MKDLGFRLQCVISKYGSCYLYPDYEYIKKNGYFSSMQPREMYSHTLSVCAFLLSSLSYSYLCVLSTSI